MLATSLTRSSIVALALFVATDAFAQPTNVTTYHYDNLRTGWNAGETTLTPATVAGASFGALKFVSLDDQVDAQPLVLPNRTIAGQGTHDVVYVATENNTVYALDATSGSVLLKTNFGAPVPQSALPGQCNNNAANVGIGGTPVIDAAAGTLYVIADTFENGSAVFRLHALDVGTLKDKVAPVLVGASARLSNGKTYSFDANASRQRAALLLANGNVYAGFSSYCDVNADQSRGWILGWQAGSLTALAANELTDKRATSPDSFFLTSVWMSGYGLASSPAGDLYFVTGNSDPDGTQYNAKNNIAESAVQLSSDLTTVKGLFTPTGPNVGHQSLDQADNDFGSGGLLLLPPQSGSPTDLAVAAGKVGIMYLLNADNLGNNSTRATGVALGQVNIGGCWCGQSYYTANDGAGRVVSSGGNNAIVWKVGNGKPRLVQVAASGGVDNNQNPGFFTAVSSNGTAAGSAVIWAVGHPVDNNPANVKLYAFKADDGSTLFQGVAGTWPNTGGNANIVPVVANGKVYVASFQSLAIYGLLNGPAAVAPTVHAAKATQAALAMGQHEVWGTVRKIEGTVLTVEKRTGDLITVDAAQAFAAFHAAQPSLGHAVLVRGTLDTAGVFHADTLLHAKDSSAMWQPDR
jgi:hypothetical protein